jgi:hypothetical protein
VVQPRDDRPFISGYGGLSVRGTSVSTKIGTLVGVRGGLMFGKRLSIGGAVYKLSRRFGKPIRDSAGNPLALKMAYGGAQVAINAIRGRRIELEARGLFGGGMGCVSADANYDRDEMYCVESVRMVVMEPEVALIVNVTDWMRMALTGGYRFVVREKWRPPNNFNLAGGTLGLDLEFGWFNRE